MQIRDERTQYPSFFGAVWHIVPDSGAPSIVQAKYGNRYRYFRDIGDTLAKMNDGDCLVIWPGSHSTTIAAGIPVTKNNITIMGQGENPYSTRIAHGAGTDIAFLVSGAGVTIKNLTFLGADADVKSISFSGAGLLVEDCIFNDCKLAISGTGASSLVRRCHFDSDNAAAIGVDLLAAASFGVVQDCDFQLSGTTGDIGVKVNDTALKCLVSKCRFNSGLSDAVSPGTQAGDVNDTETAENTKNNETAAAWIAT